jgi:hypothetical protein
MTQPRGHDATRPLASMAARSRGGDIGRSEATGGGSRGTRVLEASVLVVDILLVQGAADALGHPALDLALDIGWPRLISSSGCTGAGRRGGTSSGAALRRQRARYSENRAFRHKTATAAGYDGPLFQPLTKQIRYLADQPNFAADQRIKAALSTEKQSNSGTSRKVEVIGFHPKLGQPAGEPAGCLA